MALKELVDLGPRKAALQPDAEVRDPLPLATLTVSEGEGALLVRNDVHYISERILSLLGPKCDRSLTKIRGEIEEAYAQFTDDVIANIVSGDSSTTSAKMRSYVLDSDALNGAIEAATHGRSRILLDPVSPLEGESLRVSRERRIDDEAVYGLVASPDSPAIGDQISQIRNGGGANFDGDYSRTVIEDDIVSGGTSRRLIDLMEEEAPEIKIDQIVAGVRFIDEERAPLHIEGVELQGVVEVRIAPDATATARLEDPRDFLLGFGGRTVRLGSSEVVRVPYMLPFLKGGDDFENPHFSDGIIRANLAFYQKLSAILEREVTTAIFPPSFQSYLKQIWNLGSSEPITPFLRHLSTRTGEELDSMNQMSRISLDILRMELPRRIIFLDVNRTLLPDDDQNWEISDEQMERFHAIQGELREKGIEIGLCSDNDLNFLKDLAEEFGIDGPILAENGNDLFYKGELSSIRGFSDRRLRELDIDIFHFMSWSGVEPGDWDFARDRTNSIAVHGTYSAIMALGDLDRYLEDISVSLDPEHGTCVIHPGVVSVQRGKAASLSILESEGYEAYLIGDCSSDFYRSPVDGAVRSIFVAGPELSEEELTTDPLITKAHGFEGVLEALEGFLTRR